MHFWMGKYRSRRVNAEFLSYCKHCLLSSLQLIIIKPPYDLIAYPNVNENTVWGKGLFREYAPIKLKTAFTNISDEEYCF